MHSLRIPEQATPWDSGLMTTKGAHFDFTFTVEGVYDYFCLPHENDEMVGRIVVGKPGNGPGTLPFDYFKGKPGTERWVPVPAVARKGLPERPDHHGEDHRPSHVRWGVGAGLPPGLKLLRHALAREETRFKL